MIKIKKIFTVTTFTICLLSSSACSTVVGAYNEDPYGPVVNCDSKLPMNELLQCVDEQYAAMDKIFRSRIIKEKDKSFKSKKKAPGLFLNSKEISYFPELKNNTLYDRDKNGNGAFHIKDDRYKNLTLGIYQNRNSNNRIGYKLRHPFKDGLVGNYIENVDINTKAYLTRKYKRSYWSASKDVLITVSNNKKKLYAASYEVVPLNNNMALYVINISAYCQQFFSQKEIEFAKKRGNFPDKNMIPIFTLPLESKEKSFYSCGSGYLYFTDITDKIPEYRYNYPIPKHEQSNQPFHYTSATNFGTYVDYKTYPNKVINLSADRRENPEKLYVNLNNRTFEIPLSEQGGNVNKQP